MVAAETSLHGLLGLAGLLCGGAVAGLGLLAASAAFGVVLATSGPLVEAATLGRAHGGDGVFGLLLGVLAVVGGDGEHWQQLLVAVNGGGSPVSLVGQGVDILVVVLGELKVNRSREAALEQHGEEAGPLLTGVDEL